MFRHSFHQSITKDNLAALVKFQEGKFDIDPGPEDVARLEVMSG